MSVPDRGRSENAARLLAFGIALLMVALTAVPWIYARSLQGSAPKFGCFLGFTHNVDDNMGYAAWIRQYAGGAIFQRNMFSSEPQDPRAFHLLFFILGRISALTGLAPPAIILIARLIGGMVLMHFLWWFLSLVTESLRARIAAWLMLCFSSGAGWIALLWPAWKLTPVDLSLPDATTFASIYFGPLPAFALALMACALGCMLLAERQRSWRWAGAAGICGLLLGNIHTYDVVTVCATWAVYVAVQGIRVKRLQRDTVLRTLLFFSLAAITTAYTGWVLLRDPVYGNMMRVQNPLPPSIDLVLGYAPLAILAAIGVALHLRASVDSKNAIARDGLLLLAVWAVVNLAVPYLPLSFQRKLLLGAHLPLAMLAGFALAALATRARPAAFAGVLAACTAVLSVSNIAYLWRDTAAISVDRTTFVNPVRPFIYAGERRALEWLSKHAEPGAVIQPLPWVALFKDRFFPGDITLALAAPSIAGHPVDLAHLSETPNYAARMAEWGFFQHPRFTDEQRLAVLRRSHVRYLVTSQKNKPDPLPPHAFAPTFFDAPPKWLKRIPAASNEDADVWRVELRE